MNQRIRKILSCLTLCALLAALWQVPAAAAPDGHALQDRLLVPRFLEDCKALIFRKEGAGPFR